MKRTKYEHLQSTLSQYLKRRQFPESETTHKKECRFNHPLQTMALKGSPSGETSIDNTLAFSSITGDATICEQQFSRLKTFLHETNGLYGTDFVNLMFPVFVHMYIELINNGHKTPAHKFFSRHSGLFRTDEKQQELLDILPKLVSKIDVSSCKEVQEYQDMKYHATLSQEAFESLNRHLKLEDNMVMMQIFNQHIKLHGTYTAATIPFEDVELLEHIFKTTDGTILKLQIEVNVKKCRMQEP